MPSQRKKYNLSRATPPKRDLEILLDSATNATLAGVDKGAAIGFRNGLLIGIIIGLIMGILVVVLMGEEGAKQPLVDYFVGFIKLAVGIFS